MNCNKNKSKVIKQSVASAIGKVVLKKDNGKNAKTTKKAKEGLK